MGSYLWRSRVYAIKEKISYKFSSIRKSSKNILVLIKSYNSKLRPLVLSVALISCNSCSLLEQSWRQLRTTSCMHSTFLGNPNNCKLCLANDFFGLQTHETWISQGTTVGWEVLGLPHYLKIFVSNTTGFIERVTQLPTTSCKSHTGQEKLSVVGSHCMWVTATDKNKV